MERQKMRKKGFTLVELLVVIAIIAMLLAILMPALSKVRQLAQRLMCGTNLSGVGKAMLSYTNEDKYERYPVSGSSGARWNFGGPLNEPDKPCTFDWRATRALPETSPPNPPTVSLSAHLYLLVKYADVAPDQFVCPGTDQTKFELSKYEMGTAYASSTVLDVWDFGAKTNEKSDGTRAKGHQSYSYQTPVKYLDVTDDEHQSYALTTRSNPRRPVMADRNPFWQRPADNTSTARMLHWSTTKKEVNRTSIPNANSMSHQKDGQNVLFADMHTAFEKASNCGIDMDNIYTVWGQAEITDAEDEKERQCGLDAPTLDPPGSNSGKMEQPKDLKADKYYPQNEHDTFLVSDLDGKG
jgi:prepilin-type N-terminal cleavage/methylation domain-containing protein